MLNEAFSRMSTVSQDDDPGHAGHDRTLSNVQHFVNKRPNNTRVYASLSDPGHALKGISGNISLQKSLSHKEVRANDFFRNRRNQGSKP